MNDVEQVPLNTHSTWWLLLPPIALCLLDASLTLYGQPAEYWAGDRTAVREMSPSFGYYLSLHPWIAGAAMMLWIAIFSALILLLPEMLALMLSVAIVLGHMSGAASWLAYRFGSYQSCNALFLVTAGLVVFAFKRGQRNDGRSALDWERTKLPDWIRWLAIALLATIPTWWYLVPR